MQLAKPPDDGPTNRLAAGYDPFRVHFESEARRRAIIENSPVGVWVIDGDNRTSYVNERAAEMLGFSVDEIIGHYLFDFMHESDVAAAREKRDRRRAGVPEQFDFRMRHRDGSDVWVAVASTPVDVSGEPNAGVLSLLYDISDRKRAEQALKSSETRLRALLDSHPDMIGHVTRDGTFLDLHPTERSRGTLPAPPEQLIGRRIDDLFEEKFAARHRAHRIAAIETGETQIWRYEREYAGDLRHMEARFTKSGDDEIVVTVRDTTDLRLAELQLEKSEERLNQAQTVAKIGCWERPFPYERVWWSDEMYRIYEMDPEDYPEPSFDDILARVHPDDVEAVSSDLHSTLATGGRFSSDVRLLLPNGKEKFVHSEGAVIKDSDGTALKIIGTTQEITQRKLVERQARQLAARLEALTEAAFDGVCVSENGIMTEVSERFAATLGYEQSDLVGVPVSKMLAPPSIAAAIGDKADGESQLRLVFAVRKDGSELPIEISAAELADGDRQIRVSAIRDVTERTRLEREIVAVGEQERRRIGRDLHDGLGQMLTGISLNLTSLSQKLGRLAPELAPEVQAITRNVQSTIADVKHVAKQLSPNVVSDGGLIQALKRLTTELDQRSDTRCTAYIEGDCDIADETAATHVYRIAQEALNNALIHSNARSIELRYRSHGATIELEILDDGIGIAPAMHRVEGSGIRNMRYRAHSLSGTLDIGQRPGGGTIVSCKYVRDSAERA